MNMSTKTTKLSTEGTPCTNNRFLIDKRFHQWEQARQGSSHNPEPPPASPESVFNEQHTYTVAIWQELQSVQFTKDQLRIK